MRVELLDAVALEHGDEGRVHEPHALGEMLLGLASTDDSARSRLSTTGSSSRTSPLLARSPEAAASRAARLR